PHLHVERRDHTFYIIVPSASARARHSCVRGSAATEMRSDSQNIFRVAIVGASTLKGRELKDVLEERNFPAVDVRLLDDDESLGQLERVQDEVSFIQPVTRDQLENIDFTFFASDEAFTRANWKLARDAGSAVVDLSYALEDDAAVPVSAPWIQRELGR